MGARDRNDSIFEKHNEKMRFTYKYQVDLALHENQVYKVYLPKQF